jgi:hypothetical protein
MKMEKLNQWLTLLANVGVIAGIAFLGFEIRQNTEMIESQTRDSITEKQIAVFEWWATSTDNNRIRTLGDNLELDINSPEAGQYSWMIAGNLRLWENEWYQYKRGLFEEEEFEPRLNIWKKLVNTPGIIYVWENGQREAFSPEFAVLIDSLIEHPQ